MRWMPDRPLRTYKRGCQGHPRGAGTLPEGCRAFGMGTLGLDQTHAQEAGGVHPRKEFDTRAGIGLGMPPYPWKPLIAA